MWTFRQPDKKRERFREERQTEIVIVIINPKLLKRHSKAKRRTPAYSRVLREIRGVFQRIVHGRLRSGRQRVRECVKSEGFSKELLLFLGCLCCFLSFDPYNMAKARRTHLTLQTTSFLLFHPRSLISTVFSVDVSNRFCSFMTRENRCLLGETFSPMSSRDWLVCILVYQSIYMA